MRRNGAGRLGDPHPAAIAFMQRSSSRRISITQAHADRRADLREIRGRQAGHLLTLAIALKADTDVMQWADGSQAGIEECIYSRSSGAARRSTTRISSASS
jgi:hypothetical protein